MAFMIRIHMHVTGIPLALSESCRETMARVINDVAQYADIVMPGTMTLNGVLQALEAGADVIKIFPGEILGMKAIKSIHGPIPQAPLMPTGGGKTAAEITEAAKECIVSVKAVT